MATPPLTGDQREKQGGRKWRKDVGGGVAVRSGQDKTSLETTPLCHIHLLRRPAGCGGHYLSVKLENKAGRVPGEQFVFVTREWCRHVSAAPRLWVCLRVHHCVCRHISLRPCPSVCKPRQGLARIRAQSILDN